MRKRAAGKVRRMAAAAAAAVLMACACLGGAPAGGAGGVAAVAEAAKSGTLAAISSFSYTNGSVQTFRVPATGTYIIEAEGAAGGDSGMLLYTDFSQKGGNGGYVRVSVNLNAGSTLYIYVGKRGDSLGDAGISPGNENGAGSGGGGAQGVRVGAGGGATEIRLNGTGEANRLIVAGGGGGAAIYTGYTGVPGGNGGAANSGNALTSKGMTAGTYGGGGGGGYRGGASGTLASQSRGGSNYAAAQCNVITNGVSTSYANGSVKITQCTSYILNVNPNGGIWNNNKNTQVFTMDQTYDVVKTFSYTGGVQTWTVPYSGYYYVHAYGAEGGDDASRGGYGGYVQAYSYFTKGTVLTVVCGGAGWRQYCDEYEETGGYNGGGAAGFFAIDDGYYHNGYSGTGGGCTHIAVSNHGTLSGYKDCTGDVIIVAGGGAGGSAASSGQGGSVLYTGSCFPGTVYNGASTSLLTSTFAQGENRYAAGWKIDGGGGGGGWFGGKAGYDAIGSSAGGGASFINTKSITAIQDGLQVTIPQSIPLSLSPDVHAGNGSVKIQYMSDTVAIPNPTRDGYTFTGWTLSGTGCIEKTNLDTTLFHYGSGQSTLTAGWKKNTGASELVLNPNGGSVNGSADTQTRIGTNGQKVNVPVPERFGYDFAGWSYARNTGSNDSWNASSRIYTYGTETRAILTAQWSSHVSKLTIDPAGGTYNGSANLVTHNNLNINSVIPVTGVPVKKGYTFQYWEETNKSDGYLASDGWHPGTRDGYLKAVYTPITYTVHYEPNPPAGLSVKGSQPNQTHTYDQHQSLAKNAEYNDATGFRINNVKFLWWNTKPDGTGTTYQSGQDVINLADTQGSVINLYAQWMVKYTVNHHTENLDGSYELRESKEYMLIPLTEWTAPLNDYTGWSQPESKPFKVDSRDTVIDLYYPLIHYSLSYDLQGGEWYEEQADGSWRSVAAPPSEYTVLTPDIHIVHPDRVGYDFTGWTGTDVPGETIDVTIRQGSLGDRSYTAHWAAQPYDVDVPVSLLFSMHYDGYASGMFDQDGNGLLQKTGYITNNSRFPVQVTGLSYSNNGKFFSTYDRTLSPDHPNLINWRLDLANGGTWSQFVPELEKGFDVSSNEIFWLAQNGKGILVMDAEDAWAMHDAFDIKEPMELGRIIYTFGVGHRKISP